MESVSWSEAAGRVVAFSGPFQPCPGELLPLAVTAHATVISPEPLYYVGTFLLHHSFYASTFQFFSVCLPFCPVCLLLVSLLSLLLLQLFRLNSISLLISPGQWPLPA